MSTSHTLSGITQVVARPDFESAAPDRWVVRFTSDHEGLRHQLYANGRLVAWTDRPQQRQFTVAAVSASQVLDIAACAPSERMIDAAGQLGLANHGQAWRGRFEVVQQPNCRAGDRLQILDELGNVLHDAPAWPTWAAPWGLGQDSFGSGGFGLDAGGAPGLGQGAFGAGALGVDARLAVVNVYLATEGVHHLTAQILRPGSPPAECEPVAVLSTPPAQLPNKLGFAGFDPDTNRMSFSI